MVVFYFLREASVKKPKWGVMVQIPMSREGAKEAKKKEPL